MKHSYWIAGQTFSPTSSGAFGQAFNLEGRALAPNDLAPDGYISETVKSGFPKDVRVTLQVAITSIFKFEDGVEDAFKTEALKAADDAERRLNDEDEYDRQQILEDLITALRKLS